MCVFQAILAYESIVLCKCSGNVLLDIPFSTPTHGSADSTLWMVQCRDRQAANSEKQGIRFLHGKKRHIEVGDLRLSINATLDRQEDDEEHDA